MSRKWTQAVWDALNTLAEKNCPQNTYNRESLLGYRRAKLVEQYSQTLDDLMVTMPAATADQVLAVLAPPAKEPVEAARRDYNRPWPVVAAPVDPQAGDKLRAIIDQQRKAKEAS